uniref:2',5'-phosphodiesterase 12 n=1 Tax=Heligmosomoides polygyrus TaxID=6339 RepID=A0A183FVG5_HELPZ
LRYFSVRVVSYNILADLYLDLSGEQGSLFFPYCPKSYQMYEYRYPLLLKELSSYDMDICFLQEVDQRMQMRYLHPLFDTLGLEMCFARKQKEVTEGSVIAFRRERFQ